MKKLSILLSLATTLIIFISCGNTKTKNTENKSDDKTTTEVEADAKEMIKTIEHFIDISEKAASDQKLTDNEIKELEIAAKALSSSKADLDKKYPKDSDIKKQMDNYKKNHKAEMEVIYQKLMNVQESLSACEGSEKLNL